MQNRRNSDSQYQTIKREIADFHTKLSDLDTKIDTIEEQVITLDNDFRKHEEVEKSLFDELLVAVLRNTESVTEVKKSVSGYVELQEDLTVIVRFVKKLSKIGVFVGKILLIFGVVGTASKYAYEWFFRHYGG